MGKFTVIPQNTFDTLQMDAGVLLKRFNPANPVAPADEDIICATSGGINPSCVPTYSDLAEDVDNVPNNMKEFKHCDGWECKISTTGLGTSPELIQMALGCADIDENNANHVIPRADLSQDDFKDIWWVGDKVNGGCVAVRLKNALSTGGFSLQTTKNGKGTVSLEITGHVSINDQKTVPMEFYSLDGDDEEYFNVTQLLKHVTSNYVGSQVESGEAFSATLTADTGYTINSVIVLMDGEDVTSEVYDAGVITIASVTGDIYISAIGAEG